MAAGGAAANEGSPNRAENYSNGVNKVDKTPLDNV